MGCKAVTSPRRREQHEGSSSQRTETLDLHGLHVDQAIAALQEKINSCKGSNCKLRVVTGQGIHSRGGRAKIKPAVIKYLKNRQYKILGCVTVIIGSNTTGQDRPEENNPGALIVNIK